MFAEKLVCSWIGALGLAAGAFCQSDFPITVVIQTVPAEVTFPNSINEKGQVAGYFMQTGVSPPGGFLRDLDRTITTFDAGFGTAAFSISATGVITGYFNSAPPPVPTSTRRGFVRDPFGNFTTFDPLGSISTMPQSINAGGDVTGYYNDANRVIHGFVRRDELGELISFDPPGSVQTMALSINAKGDITGFYNEANNVVHGFVRQPGGEIVSFDAPESKGTFPASINNAGAITGYYTVANGRAFGFVRHPDGKFTSFDPGANTFPRSINNKGAIAGSYTNDTGTHGFVRAPNGSVTSFDPLPGVCFVPSFTLPTTNPTSINDDGAITGWCQPGGIVFIMGWVRIP
jgi:hypothetical protein